MSRGVMVYWGWRMAPSGNGSVSTSHSMEGACVHHRLSRVAASQPRTTESGQEEPPMMVLHQDAFAAGYHKDEYILLGLAIKYAGLHNVAVTIIGKNE